MFTNEFEIIIIMMVVGTVLIKGTSSKEIIKQIDWIVVFLEIFRLASTTESEIYRQTSLIRIDSLFLS